MEHTHHQIETLASAWATTLLMLSGAQALCDGLQTQWGFIGTCAALCGVLVAWQAPLLRDLMPGRPRTCRLITALAVLSLTIAMTAVTHQGAA